MRKSGRSLAKTGASAIAKYAAHSSLSYHLEGKLSPLKKTMPILPLHSSILLIYLNHLCTLLHAQAGFETSQPVLNQVSGHKSYIRTWGCAYVSVLVGYVERCFVSLSLPHFSDWIWPSHPPFYTACTKRNFCSTNQCIHHYILASHLSGLGDFTTSWQNDVRISILDLTTSILYGFIIVANMFTPPLENSSQNQCYNGRR